MKYYVFYVIGEVCVEQTGVMEFELEQDAIKFVAGLNVWDQWFMVHGTPKDKANMSLEALL